MWNRHVPDEVLVGPSKLLFAIRFSLKPRARSLLIGHVRLVASGYRSADSV